MRRMTRMGTHRTTELCLCVTMMRMMHVVVVAAVEAQLRP